MALHCISDDRDTESIPTKRAVSRKRPTRSGFLSHRLGAWPTAVTSPTTPSPWVYSPAEPSSLDDFEVYSSSGAGKTHDHPYFPTVTPLSICLGQLLSSVHVARYSRIWPVVDLTDCRSHTSRCSSPLSAGQDTNSAVGHPTSISFRVKKQERESQNTGVDTTLDKAEHVLDTFRCQHCEKSFATRSTLRSVSRCSLVCRPSGLLTSGPDTMKSSTTPSELTNTTAQLAKEDFATPRISSDILPPIDH